MNKTLIKNSIGIFISIAMVMGLFATTATPAYANCNTDPEDPAIVMTRTPTNVTHDHAILNAYFASGDTCINALQPLEMVFEFGETSAMSMQSEPILQYTGSRTVSIDINDLQPNETYYYRAVLYDGTRIVRSSVVKFRTPDEPERVTNEDNDGFTVEESDEVIDLTNTNTATTQTTVVPAAPTNTSNNNSGFGGIAQTTTNAEIASPRITVAPVDLSIDNGTDVLRAGAFVTYDITYENTSTSKELEDAVLTVTFPEQVRFESASEGNYNNRREALIVNVGDLRPGDSGALDVVVRVRGAGTETTAVATAELSYRDIDERARIRVTDTDIDEVEQTQSGLAAGLFSGNFAPGSVIGWLVVGLLLLAIIYLVRVHVWKYYWAKKRPEKPRNVQEQSIGQAPHRG